MYQKFRLSTWHNSLLYASEDSISSVSPGEKRCHCIHMGVTILLLLATQGLILIAAAALSFLTFAGLMNAPLLLGFTFLLGLGASLGNPAWQAVNADLVPSEELPAAVTLSSVAYNLARGGTCSSRPHYRGRRTGSGVPPQRDSVLVRGRG